MIVKAEDFVKIKFVIVFPGLQVLIVVNRHVLMNVLVKVDVSMEHVYVKHLISELIAPFNHAKIIVITEELVEMEDVFALIHIQDNIVKIYHALVIVVIKVSVYQLDNVNVILDSLLVIALKRLVKMDVMDTVFVIWTQVNNL